MTVRELIEKLQEFDEWNEVDLCLTDVCVLDILPETDKNGCTHFSSDGDLEVKKYDVGKVVIMAEGY